ncbi:MAG TPA: hypothetical protein VKV40_19840 [Ktedonobacteraceae bacterium]|nr:hypothetical protein [Ktedonobacteraceae bacterium]
MAQPDIHVAGSTSSLVDTGARADRPDRVERYLRRTAAWVMLVFLLQGQLGAIWDREWHFFVGRDWFWTPPHTLIYSCVSGAGLVALVMVLTDTIRYRKGAPGVDDNSTVPVFGIFHAPLGFVIAGFGALVTLAAAPLDNYWHNLYGIDITLWAPFHMMGVTGGAIGILGMIYVFASEATIQRVSGHPYQRPLGLSLLEWGVLFIIAGMINFTFIGFLQFPIATFGLLRIPTYALPLALCGGFALIGAVRFTHLPGTATLIIPLVLIHTFLEELFVPWAIRTAVSLQGLQYRVQAVPYFNMTDALLPLIFLVSALIVDGVALWRLRHNQKLNGSLRNSWLLGIIITIPQLITAPCLLIGSLNLPAVFLDQPGVTIPTDLKLQAALIAVPVILAFGAIGGLAGANFGDIWRWNKS